MTPLPLNQVPAGATVTVIDVADDCEIQVQLAARGVLPGTQLCVRSTGRMIVICADSTRWAISTEHAATILTLPETAVVPVSATVDDLCCDDCAHADSDDVIEITTVGTQRAEAS